MNTNIFLIAAWSIVVGVFFSRMMKKQKNKKETVTLVKAEEFNQITNKNQLIDVRDSESYNNEHIAGARNITVSNLKKSAESKLFKDKPIYLYCNTGTTAKRAAKILVNQEFQKIVVLNDSFDNYPGNKIANKKKKSSLNLY